MLAAHTPGLGHLSLHLVQDEMRAIMEENRKNILQYNTDGERVRIDTNIAIDAKHRTEDECNLENEWYGISESWRLEDLENLVKLKSLLRMLYYKKKPVDCPHNPKTKVLCSGMDRGWCVTTEKHPKMDQRCSCNVGFYGPACEFVMCPGIAKNLYEHDAEGVCSNTNVETRGQCDKHLGLCTCFDGEGHLRGQHPGGNPEFNIPTHVGGGITMDQSGPATSRMHHHPRIRKSTTSARTTETSTLTRPIHRTLSPTLMATTRFAACATASMNSGALPASSKSVPTAMGIYTPPPPPMPAMAMARAPTTTGAARAPCLITVGSPAAREG